MMFRQNELAQTLSPQGVSTGSRMEAVNSQIIGTAFFEWSVNYPHWLLRYAAPCWPHEYDYASWQGGSVKHEEAFRYTE